ncbi:MAG TPA: glycosyltransferase family 39 protein [Vicinamibacterales bacterium]|nr:glycosyltransferase family 39 protein [Vicinamibacterales bacterium]
MTAQIRAGLPLEQTRSSESLDATSAAEVVGSSTRRSSTSTTRRVLLAAMLIVAAGLGSRGILSEGSVSLQGDMPRYMMNGAFLADFLLSGEAWTPHEIFRFAERYYAQYPALSLGHHPPLLPAVLASVYAVVGISVFWSRVTILVFFVVAAWAMFSMTRRLYDERVAVWATLLFVTNPAVTSYGQVVLSEMPMLTLVLLAMDALGRFSESGRARHYAWFVIAAVASLYAKQLAIFMVPAYLVYLLMYSGWRRLIKRDVLGLTLLGLLASLPMAAITFILSPENVAVVRFISSTGRGLMFAQSLLWTILGAQLTVPIFLLVLAGVVLSIVRRDRRILVGLAWTLGVLAAVVYLTGRSGPERYAMVAVPGYFLCAAAVCAAARSKRARWTAAAVLGAAVIYQVWLGRNVRPHGAEGYEAAAQYVLSHGESPTILFSGPVDTGYFVFFVRKHDPRAQHIVLRADKIFTTSRMSRSSVEDRINDRHEIYVLLRRYGTRFVVIEDRTSDSHVLEWLREELKTERFIERHRIPVGTSDRRLRGVSLAIYEYRDTQPPDPAAELELHVPLVGRQVRVPLAELIDIGRQ